MDIRNCIKEVMARSSYTEKRTIFASCLPILKGALENFVKFVQILRKYNILMLELMDILTGTDRSREGRKALRILSMCLYKMDLVDCQRRIRFCTKITIERFDDNREKFWENGKFLVKCSWSISNFTIPCRRVVQTAEKGQRIWNTSLFKTNKKLQQRTGTNKTVNVIGRLTNFYISDSR